MVAMPLMEKPFEQVAIDIVGPLPQCCAGFHYILVLVDYAPQYPEAVPMRTVSVGKAAEELLKIFTYVGLPRERLIDQGSNFMTRIFKEICAMLKIWHLQISVYHPQLDGLDEWFN